MGTGRLPTGRLLHQRYRILHVVGHGGMGAVYIAQDTQLGDRMVAVKEMSMSRLAQQELPQAVAQFQREAHLLASLQHPNLPIIYEYFGEEDRWYLVMSFVPGGTLQSYLDATPGNKLPVQEVIRIGIDLCNVLDYLHTHQPQIIFRDLKPLNVMITPKEQIYLIDFGIARHFKQEQTKDTTFYYSIGYAPPEQYGQSQTGPRSDVYSLGATLYQMLTGHNPAGKPFRFPSLQLVDPTIPVPLAKLITQMLELDEQQRPDSAVVVKEELEKVLQSGQGEKIRKGDDKKKEKARVENVSMQQDVPMHSGRAWQNSWDRIDLFFHKNRVPFWICFMVLSALLGVWGAIVVRDYSNDLPFLWFGVVGIGATLVCLALLLSRGRVIVDILGGIAFTLLGNILLIFGLYLFYMSDFRYYYDDNAPFNFRFMFWCTIIATLLLLLLGTRLLVRSANLRIGAIFGALLLIVGIAWLIYSRSFTDDVYNYYTVILPNVVPWLAIAEILLGIVALIIMLLKGRRNKQTP
jgi:serine/threonine protein kinase